LIDDGSFANLVPSPFHAQLLKAGDGVYLGQTATGWVNNSLKLSFANLQIDAGIINVDGHHHRSVGGRSSSTSTATTPT
jgi:hypothetical protein